MPEWAGRLVSLRTSAALGYMYAVEAMWTVEQADMGSLASHKIQRFSGSA